MSSKRQQTMAKMTRERKVKEKRERKLEKKQVAAAEKAARAAGIEFPSTTVEDGDEEVAADEGNEEIEPQEPQP